MQRLFFVKNVKVNKFENSYSNMDLKNQKGFTIIEQLKPKIIIPTHYTTKSLETMKARYGNLTEFDNILEITKEDLPDSILNVYRILNNHKFE